MNKKILRYEIKRIVFSKMFIVTFMLALAYSLIDLYINIVKGVSGTAPFSQWSYCKFLCDINTILLLIVMLFCTDLFSKQESMVKEITLFTSIPYRKVLSTKCLAIFISYSIVTLSCILTSLIFYKTTFNFTNFQNFILPILIILIPTFIFIFSGTIYLGSKKQILIYIFIPIVMFFSFFSFYTIPLFDIFAKGYITNAPKIAEIDITGEPIFSLSLSFIISRFSLILLGIFLYIITFCRKFSK